MSKLDAQRAMREARYAERQKAAGQPAARRTTPRPPVAPPATPSSRPADATGSGPAGEQLCGHRNMSGRTCTREHGHAAKSHRYS